MADGTESWRDMGTFTGDDSGGGGGSGPAGTVPTPTGGQTAAPTASEWGELAKKFPEVLKMLGAALTSLRGGSSTPPKTPTQPQPRQSTKRDQLALLLVIAFVVLMLSEE